MNRNELLMSSDKLAACLDDPIVMMFYAGAPGQDGGLDPPTAEHPEHRAAYDAEVVHIPENFGGKRTNLLWYSALPR